MQAPFGFGLNSLPRDEGDREARARCMFAVERKQLVGPRWIANFPTGQHWRHRPRIGSILGKMRDVEIIVFEPTGR